MTWIGFGSLMKFLLDLDSTLDSQMYVNSRLMNSIASSFSPIPESLHNLWFLLVPILHLLILHFRLSVFLYTYSYFTDGNAILNRFVHTLTFAPRDKVENVVYVPKHSNINPLRLFPKAISSFSHAPGLLLLRILATHSTFLLSNSIPLLLAHKLSHRITTILSMWLQPLYCWQIVEDKVLSRGLEKFISGRIMKENKQVADILLSSLLKSKTSLPMRLAHSKSEPRQHAPKLKESYVYIPLYLVWLRVAHIMKERSYTCFDSLSSRPALLGKSLDPTQKNRPKKTTSISSPAGTWTSLLSVRLIIIGPPATVDIIGHNIFTIHFPDGKNETKLE